MGNAGLRSPTVESDLCWPRGRGARAGGRVTLVLSHVRVPRPRDGETRPTLEQSGPGIALGIDRRPLLRPVRGGTGEPLGATAELDRPTGRDVIIRGFFQEVRQFCKEKGRIN